MASPEELPTLTISREHIQRLAAEFNVSPLVILSILFDVSDGGDDEETQGIRRRGMGG
ncbi:MAG: hypothetical protein M3179_02855 [Actinomycetota bacterium]|nr:hypothetical protein [Actinomycetota bacterium]